MFALRFDFRCIVDLAILELLSSGAVDGGAHRCQSLFRIICLARACRLGPFPTLHLRGHLPRYMTGNEQELVSSQLYPYRIPATPRTRSLDRGTALLAGLLTMSRKHT